MATFALLNAFSYVAGHDFTTDTNQVQASSEAEAKDGTTFASNGWKEIVGGLRSVEFAMAGFWQSAASDAVDPDAFNDLAVLDQVYTVGDRQVEGDVAYMFQAGKFTYQLLGEIGEVTPFQLGCQGTKGTGVVRGQLAKARGNVSAIGALGTALNLGAAVAGQSVYAAFHVFAAATTITVVVESAAASDFVGAVTRATIGPVTSRGGVWVTPGAGPITDTWWRLRVTAVTGTFNVAGAIAVQ